MKEIRSVFILILVWGSYSTITISSNYGWLFNEVVKFCVCLVFTFAVVRVVDFICDKMSKSRE